MSREVESIALIPKPSPPCYSLPLLLPLDDDQLLPGAPHLLRLGHGVLCLVRLGGVVIEDPGAASLGVRVVIGVGGVLLCGQIILENVIRVVKLKRLL